MNSLPGKSKIEFILTLDFGACKLLVLSTSLNHWLPGSHMFSLLKHLQVFVTMTLLESTSRQTTSPLLVFDEMCNLESEMISHFELDSVQIIPSCAGFPTSSACRQKYVPFTVKVFCGVYFQASASEHGPNFNGSRSDFLRTQRPVNGWKMILYGRLCAIPGPENILSMLLLCFLTSVTNKKRIWKSSKILRT